MVNIGKYFADFWKKKWVRPILYEFFVYSFGGSFGNFLFFFIIWEIFWQLLQNKYPNYSEIYSGTPLAILFERHSVKFLCLKLLEIFSTTFWAVALRILLKISQDIYLKFTLQNLICNLILFFAIFFIASLEKINKSCKTL